MKSHQERKATKLNFQKSGKQKKERKKEGKEELKKQNRKNQIRWSKEKRKQ